MMNINEIFEQVLTTKLQEVVNAATADLTKRIEQLEKENAALSGLVHDQVADYLVTARDKIVADVIDELPIDNIVERAVEDAVSVAVEDAIGGVDFDRYVDNALHDGKTDLVHSIVSEINVADMIDWDSMAQERDFVDAVGAALKTIVSR